MAGTFRSSSVPLPMMRAPDWCHLHNESAELSESTIRTMIRLSTVNALQGKDNLDGGWFYSYDLGHLVDHRMQETMVA